MIAVRDLSFSYPRAEGTALQGCSFELRPGEISVVLGPSGSGKSTLLRCLAGLLPAWQGEISDPQGRQPRDASLRQWRQGTGVVFQDHALIPHRSVLWHVCCGALARYHWCRSLLWWRRPDVDRALGLLHELGLADKIFEPVRRLSGGQRQRVGIARALMQDCALLLADEPIASLDPAAADQFMQHCRKLIGHDRACLISLHQVDYALRWADRIIALRGGRILYDGPADECGADVRAALYQAHNQPSPAENAADSEGTDT